MNDTYGHRVGDRCLQEIAKAIKDITALPAAMRYILKAETYYKGRDKRKTIT
ncbi:diguanylate cyclase domain-containing protein [Nostoc commune]|uniref:diguanylate cyclase domain-containing protein n=1 Tax=Nostoc commune TaxID=1178 RepID=UPI002ED9AC49